MANRIRTGDPRGFNKGRSSKFHEGSRVRQTPEEGRRTYRLKCCGNNKKEDNSLKTLILQYSLQIKNLHQVLRKSYCIYKRKTRIAEIFVNNYIFCIIIRSQSLFYEIYAVALW